MQTHIAIATTQGPIFVQKLTEEEEDVMSLVCLNETPKQLSISRAYVDFVKKGSGFIEKDFGHPAWRLDISANIDTGDSWQLPVYLAHYFFAGGTLGNGQPTKGDRIILSTGELRSTRETVAVEYVSKKVQAAVELIEEWKSEGIEVCWVVNPDNLSELPVDANSIVMSRLDDIDNLTSGPRTELVKKETAKKRPGRNPAKRVLFFFTAVALALMVGEWLWFAGKEDTSLDDFGGKARDGFPQPVQETALTQLKIVSSNERFLCDHPSSRQNILQADNGGDFAGTRLAETCTIKLLKRGGQAAAWLYSLDSGALRELTWQGGDLAGWVVPLPQNQTKDRPYAIVIFAESPDAAKLAALEDSLDTMLPATSNFAAQARKVVQGLGGEDEIYFHRLLVD